MPRANGCSHPTKGGSAINGQRAREQRKRQAEAAALQAQLPPTREQIFASARRERDAALNKLAGEQLREHKAVDERFAAERRHVWDGYEEICATIYGGLRAAG